MRKCFFIFLITSFFSVASNAQQLKSNAQIMNEIVSTYSVQTFPVEMDAITSWTGVEYLTRGVTQIYTVSATKADFGAGLTSVATQNRASNKNLYCTNPLMAELRTQFVEVRYKYIDINGEELWPILIMNPNSC